MGMTRQYLEQLSESIGPRPVASDTERDAADWIRQRFTEHGLSTTVQDFDSVRSLSGAHLLYALITVAGAALMGPAHRWPALCWLLWALTLVAAILAWLEFSGHNALSRAFPKGPSQNVIGRYTPLARPGEELSKVVLVAHYDSDRSTPFSSDAIAGAGRIVTKLAHGVIMAAPIFALAPVLPVKFITKLYPYTWYGLMVICIPAALLLINLVLAALIRRYSPGANNNASGVAALLSICEDLAGGATPALSSATNPEDAGKFGTGALSSANFATGAFSAIGSSTTGTQAVSVQQGGLAEGSDFDATFDFGVRPQSGSAAPERATSSFGNYEDYDARETFADAQTSATTTPAGAARHSYGATTDFGLDKAATGDDAPYGASGGGGEVLGADVIAGGPASDDDRFSTGGFAAMSASGGKDEAGADDFAAFAAGVSSGRITRGTDKKKKKGLFGRRAKKDELSDGFGAAEQPSEWLGVDTEYDAREEGRKIGSWENFASGQSDDDFDGGDAWKGGAAEGDVIEDEAYAAAQAARIRRRISEAAPTGLTHKDLWFVATSAHYVHSHGIRTFLEDYREELRGALFINLDALGTGDLYWSVTEQAGKTYKSSARLTASARRVAREKNIRAKPFKKGKLRTEAGWALADGRKAVTITRLTESGVAFAAGSSQDVVSRLSVEKIDEAVEFVISLIDEL